MLRDGERERLARQRALVRRGPEKSCCGAQWRVQTVFRVTLAVLIIGGGQGVSFLVKKSRDEVECPASYVETTTPHSRQLSVHSWCWRRGHRGRVDRSQNGEVVRHDGCPGISWD